MASRLLSDIGLSDQGASRRIIDRSCGGRVPDEIKVLGSPDLEAKWCQLGLALMADQAQAVNTALAQWAAGRDARQAMREAQRAGWPVVVVHDPLMLHEDEHLRARGFWVTADHPVAGAFAYTGAPWRVAGAGWKLRSTAPTLGQETDVVLSELLGMSKEEIWGLRTEGSVA